MSEWEYVPLEAQAYINYLSEDVVYSGKPRPRVRYIKQYKDNMDAQYKHGEPLDIFADPDRRVFFWSDTHFGHKNIISFSDRPFADIRDMQDTLIANHNAVVRPQDIVIWGGDVAFMNTQVVNEEILSRLNGYRILVIGNHDFNKKKLRQFDFDEIHLVYNFRYQNIDYIVTHYPLTDVPMGTINIHGHLHDRVTNRPEHISICVELIKYAPISMGNIAQWAWCRIQEREG